jgi:hypothetical protein
MIRLSMVIAACLAATAVAEQPAPIEMPPVVFEGFGLGDFKGPGSIAGAMRRAVPSTDAAALPLDIVVRGPGGSGGSLEPLATELRSRISVLDVSAGVVATPDVVHEGLTRWIGGVKLASDHAAGREVIELRTTLTQAETTGVFGVELGPRIERRLRRGAVVFFDGKAEARAFKSAETGTWTLPGDSSAAMVGVTARTGLKR